MTGERDFEKENAKVEKALFQAATGHVVKLKKPVKVKEETNRPGEGKQVTEKLVTVVEIVRERVPLGVYRCRGYLNGEPNEKGEPAVESTVKCMMGGKIVGDRRG